IGWFVINTKQAGIVNGKSVNHWSYSFWDYEDPTVNKKRSNEIGTREKCGQIFVCFKNGFRSIKDAEER
ncbi:MAG: hypothetical protein E7C90_09935, partial [Haemophilus parainfluenzae]|nr:hypothetical protein [Haemophilus parainfluenzae]